MQRRTGFGQWALVLLLALTMVGCFPQAMRRAATDITSARPGQALIIFVRVGSDKDRFANVAVALADDKGHFVAALGLNEHVAIEVPPGPHEYVAFRGAGGKIKAFHAEEPAPLPAIFVEAAAGKVYYVAANLVSETAEDHSHDAYQPNVMNVAGAAVAGQRIGEGLFGKFGGTRLVPLGERFGNDAASIQSMINKTEAREIHPDNARAFDRDVQEEYWWSHSWQGAVENGRAYPPPVREARTLHAADGS